MATKPCSKCNTDQCYKYDLIQELKKEIKRILNAYKRDKKFNRIIMAILSVGLISSIAYGKESIKIVVDWVMRWFGK